MTAEDRRPKTDDQEPIVWTKVSRVLIVKLRSIGDTVLCTPSLIALRKFLPDAQIDILLEDWVAPVLDGFAETDEVVILPKGNAARLRVARELRRRRYDVVFNLHGGTTGTFLTFATGARHRVGYSHYQYSFLYDHLLSSSSDYWRQPQTHSAEQQLALLGFVGIPVEDRPKSSLAVTSAAMASVDARLTASGFTSHDPAFALIHPAAAFATKQWAPSGFARTAEFLAQKGIRSVAIATKNEREILAELVRGSAASVVTFDDLLLPEIAALASKARIFVGNDSGIAHMAAAVGTPSVVVFGSSNRNHWSPWTDAPHEMVFEELPCQPCPGYVCSEFGEPKCILTVRPDSVTAAIDRLL